MTITEENKDGKKKAIRRTKRLEARVTEKEYAKVVELAETCGLTVSDQPVRCTRRPYAYSCCRQIYTGQQTSAIFCRHSFRGTMDACCRSSYSPLE